MNQKINKNLIDAAGRGDLVEVQAAIQRGADLHVSKDHPLRLSALNGHADVVQYLINMGADVHADQDYALRYSTYYGHELIIKNLVSRGADVHADNDYVLRHSVYKDWLPMIQYFVENGANVEIGLQEAYEEGNPQVISWLETYINVKRECEALLSEIEDCSINQQVVRNRL